MLQRRAQNHKQETVQTVGIIETNLFGPQSRWSLLLGQREHLENEILRGQKYMARLQKDLADWETLMGNWRGRTTWTRNGRPVRKQRAHASDSMVQFLTTWLDHLHVQLNAVTSEIQALERRTSEPALPEESMLALLRAAG